MAKIHKHWTGYYYLDVRVGGRRIQRSLKTRDVRVARLKAEREVARFEGHAVVSRTTIEAFEKEFFEWSKVQKSCDTQRAERTALKHVKEILGIQHLDEISSRDVDHLVVRLVPGRSPASVNCYIRTLRSIFAQAQRWGYLDSNPFNGTKQLTTDQVEPRILSVAECQTLIGKIRELRPALMPLVEFLLLTGVRRSEALGLEKGDIDFEKGLITLRKTKGKQNGKRKLRFVPMTPRVRDILSARMELPRIFPWRRDFVTREFGNAADKAELARVTLHDLRRTFASMCAEKGLSSFGVQRALGHSDIRTTATYYAASYPEEILRAMVEVERSLGEKAPPPKKVV
jgi:integrase